MAKDYFQDIVPPAEAEPSHNAGSSGPRMSGAPPPDRSVRNITISPRARSPVNDMRGTAPPGAGRFGAGSRAGRGGRSWLWVLVGISLLALLILLVLFVFRKTTVTILPQSQQVVFDQSAEFTAYPPESAASGTLSYTVRSNDFEDSEVVPSSGTRHSETKAEGSITVINDYSAAPVKLVKDTRFETASGLIFKVPAEIVVPGRGSSAGKVSVTVVADKAGASYNVGPTAHFTLPGLRSNAAMYRGVYAYSSSAMSGGFSGNEPAVDPGALGSAITKMQNRIQDKADQFKRSLTSDAVVVFAHAEIKSMPDTSEAGGGVRIHRVGHVEVAAVTNTALAQAVGQTVAANVSGAALTLKPLQDGFTIHPRSEGSTTSISGPIPFTIAGHGLLVWKVDMDVLARALAGRNSGAFQTIVSNFPGVQSAHARIEPFWESTFPSNPGDIHITVETPKTPQ